MKRVCVVLLACLLSAGAAKAGAQVVHDGTWRQPSLTIGAMGSFFQPDYMGGNAPNASPQYLVGIGTYLDLKLTRWVQAEGEARVLRFHQYHNIYQDNYLIGPKVPIHTWGPVTPYGKVLFGITNMNFEYNVTNCHCATIAYGGGADVKLDDHWSLRAIDFEYQQFPDWLVGQTAQLHPYGFSVGLGYKLF